MTEPTTEAGQLPPLDREEYPVGSVVRVADMGAIERAWAEAEHEGCPEEPAGHLLTEHEPWSGGDLDGVETWASFTARLARHGLRIEAEARASLDVEVLARALSTHVTTHKTHSRTHVTASCAAAIARAYAAEEGS